MRKRKILDHNRSYGEISPPVDGACYTQDGVNFNHDGVEIRAEGAEPFAETVAEATEAAQPEDGPAFELSDLGKQVQVLCDPTLPPPADVTDEAKGNYSLLRGWQSLTWQKQIALATKLTTGTNVTKAFAYGVFKALVG